MGPLHNKQALLFIHFMCVRRPFSTRQLPPATYRFPLKGISVLKAILVKD